MKGTDIKTGQCVLSLHGNVGLEVQRELGRFCPWPSACPEGPSPMASVSLFSHPPKHRPVPHTFSLSLLSSFSLLHTPGTLPLEASPWPPAMGACISAFICSFIHPDSFIQMCTEPPVCCCIVKLGPGDPETKAVQPRLGTLRLWGGRLQNSCSYTIQLILLFLLHSQLVSHGRTLPAPLGSRGLPPAASRSGGPLTITTLCSLCAKFSVLHMSRFL